MNTHLRTSRASFIRAAQALAGIALFSTAAAPAAFAAPTPKPGDISGSLIADARVPIGPDTTPGDNDATPSLFKITRPGSYYLPGNILGVAGKHGIEIAASDVTLDLNGFMVRGVAGSLVGIDAGTSQNITLRNGSVREWHAGIQVLGDRSQLVDLKVTSNSGLGIFAGKHATLTDCVAASNGGDGVTVNEGSVLTRVVARQNAHGFRSTGPSVRFVDCTAIGNSGRGYWLSSLSTLVGCFAGGNTAEGYVLANYAMLDRCAASDNGGHGFSGGFSCTLKSCVARYNDQHGFKLAEGSVVTDSTANDNAADGFEVSGSRVDTCVALQNGQNGFSLGVRSQLRNSLAQLNGLHGVAAAGSCQVAGNHATGNGTNASTGAGVYASGAANHIDGNTCSGNDRGLSVVSGGNFVVRNTARGNQANYSFAAGVAHAEVLTDPPAGFASANPWANFAY